MPQLTELSDRKHIPLYDTWDPNQWFEVLPGVRVYAPAFAYEAMQRSKSFDWVLAALRDKFAHHDEVFVQNGQKIRCATVRSAVKRDAHGIGASLQTVSFTTLTRQGVADLNRVDGRGYNGARSSCPHKTPGMVSTYAQYEDVAIDGSVQRVRATYCSGCDARLWDDRGN